MLFLQIAIWLPNKLWATARRKVLSTPPEKATSRESSSDKMETSFAFFACSDFITPLILGVYKSGTIFYGPVISQDAMRRMKSFARPESYFQGIAVDIYTPIN